MKNKRKFVLFNHRQKLIKNKIGRVLNYYENQFYYIFKLKKLFKNFYFFHNINIKILLSKRIKIKTTKLIYYPYKNAKIFKQIN